MGIFQALPTVVDSTEHFCDAQSRVDVEQFFRTHPVPGTERTLAQALEAIERCELIEVSTPELDDVIRLEDDFGREGTNAP